MWLYNNIYYRFYRLNMILGESGIPRQNAIFLFSLVQIFNLIELVALVSILSGKIYLVDWPKLPLLLVGLVIIFINAFIIFNKKRYQKIEKQFQDESRVKTIIGIIFTILYVIFTFTFFALILIYLDKNPIINK